jgi:hypothetical protein
MEETPAVTPSIQSSYLLAMGSSIDTETNQNRRMKTSTQESSTKKSKKRRRTTLSCVKCHQRKVKCDRSLPCSSCISFGAGESCSFYLAFIRRNDRINEEAGNKSEKHVMDGYDSATTTESEYDLFRRLSSSSMSSEASQHGLYHDSALSCPSQSHVCSGHPSPAESFTAPTPGQIGILPTRMHPVQMQERDLLMQAIHNNSAGQGLTFTSPNPLLDYSHQARGPASLGSSSLSLGLYDGSTSRTTLDNDEPLFTPTSMYLPTMPSTVPLQTYAAPIDLYDGDIQSWFYSLRHLN